MLIKGPFAAQFQLALVASAIVLLTSVPVTAAHAQGLMPIPNVSGATAMSTAALASGTADSGTYSYGYTLTNPLSATGEIWLFKVDVSTMTRWPLNPGATFPVQGGAATAPMSDHVQLLEPFSGTRGSRVVLVDQRAPAGWNGGLNRQGFVQFAASDRAFSIQPGVSRTNFEVRSNQPPTIREAMLVPWWVPLYDDHDTATSEDRAAAFQVERSLPVHGYVLGPHDLPTGERLREDLLQAQAIGWIGDAQLLAALLGRLDAALAARQAGDGATAQTLLQGFIDAVGAAPAGAATPEFRQLATLNAAYLIATTTDFISTPTVIVDPERSVIHPGNDFVLDIHFVDTSQHNAPMVGRRLLARCAPGFECANYNPGAPGDVLFTDAAGRTSLSFEGENTGTDRIEIGEGEGPLFLSTLATAEVVWTAQADLVVPAFVPPVIRASAGDTIYLTDRTQNRGQENIAIETTTRYYISATQPIDLSVATVLGERRVPALSAGESSDSVEMPFVVPSGFTGELNYLAACADDDGEIAEIDESNNCSFSELGSAFGAAAAIESDFVANVTVTGASGAEGNFGSTLFPFNVSIDQPDPNASVAVTVSTRNGTAIAGQDYEPLTRTIVFAPHTTQLTQTVFVTVNGDLNLEPDETFYLALTNPSRNARIATAQATATIVNDDHADVTITDVAQLEGDTGSTAFAFEVSIDQADPTAAVVVQLSTENGTATAGDDYEPLSRQIQFAAGTSALTQQVVVNVRGDTTVEPDESFYVDVSAISPNAAVLRNRGVGTILNDDSQRQLNCSTATIAPKILWPPNHNLVPARIAGVFDSAGNPAQIVVTSLQQDEPVNGLGDGDTSPDGVGVGTNSAQVRRERSGTGDGRVYIISFRATGAGGASCTGSVTVGVPHDQGQGSTPIDSGLRFDSTAP